MSDTWLKAAFFASMWVVATYSIVSGLFYLLSFLDAGIVRDGAQLALALAFGTWLFGGCGHAASGAHGSHRMFWPVVVGMWLVGAMAAFAWGVVLMGLTG